MEKSLSCRENGIPKEVYERATGEPYSFLYLDKQRIFSAKQIQGEVLI